MKRYSFDTRIFVIRRHSREDCLYAINRQEWAYALEWINRSNPRGDKALPHVPGRQLFYNEAGDVYEMLPANKLISMDDLEWSWREVFSDKTVFQNGY